MLIAEFGDQSRCVSAGTFLAEVNRFLAELIRVALALNLVLIVSFLSKLLERICLEVLSKILISTLELLFQFDGLIDDCYRNFGSFNFFLFFFIFVILSCLLISVKPLYTLLRSEATESLMLELTLAGTLSLSSAVTSISESSRITNLRRLAMSND